MDIFFYLVKFDENKTEEFNMANNGFFMYYDAGQILFEKRTLTLLIRVLF